MYSKRHLNREDLNRKKNPALYFYLLAGPYCC